MCISSHRLKCEQEPATQPAMRWTRAHSINMRRPRICVHPTRISALTNKFRFMAIISAAFCCRRRRNRELCLSMGGKYPR